MFIPRWLDLLPRARKYGMVLLKRRTTDQGVGPAGQRQSRARAERGSRSCLDWMSRTKNWPLSCRDSPERTQTSGPCTPSLWWADKELLINPYLIFEVRRSYEVKQPESASSPVISNKWGNRFVSNDTVLFLDWVHLFRMLRRVCHIHQSVIRWQVSILM